MPSNNALAVGKRLVELCNQHKEKQAMEELYAANIVSVEAMQGPNMPQRIEGIDAVRKKGEWWVSNHEIHSSSAAGPYPHGDRFIVNFKYDVTSKTGPMAGQRMKLDECGLYTVKDGKIVQEEFFYDMG